MYKTKWKSQTVDIFEKNNPCRVLFQALKEKFQAVEIVDVVDGGKIRLYRLANRNVFHIPPLVTNESLFSNTHTVKTIRY